MQKFFMGSKKLLSNECKNFVEEKYQVYRNLHLYNFHWWWQVVRLIISLFKTFVSLFLMPLFDWMNVYFCFSFHIYSLHEKVQQIGLSVGIQIMLVQILLKKLNIWIQYDWYIAPISYYSLHNISFDSISS